MDQPAPHERNADQAAYWNGPGGRHWTDRQELQDAVLAPVSELLFGRAEVAAGERALDIGCGCGATSVELVRRVGPAGHVFGLDLSAPMLERARERTPPGAPATFVAADATVYPFEPGGADLLFSRFGVMFFAEPARSFANMRKGLRRGGRVAFACWREPRQNPWLMIPLQAAYQYAPRLPEIGPEDPGPFSFASEERVHRVLSEAGFAAIAMHPADLSLDVAVGRGLEAAVEGALEIGPASRALQDQPPEIRSAAANAIRAALAPFQQGASVPLAGAIWVVTATSP
ncbi:MAG: class I SAM-dependent methyltransferase [Roseiarcus sp.]|jgi:SAM-dependent methyltransferase